MKKKYIQIGILFSFIILYTAYFTDITNESFENNVSRGVNRHNKIIGEKLISKNTSSSTKPNIVSNNLKNSSLIYNNNKTNGDNVMEKLDLNDSKCKIDDIIVNNNKVTSKIYININKKKNYLIKLNLKNLENNNLKDDFSEDSNFQNQNENLVTIPVNNKNKKLYEYKEKLKEKDVEMDGEKNEKDDKDTHILFGDLVVLSDDAVLDNKSNNVVSMSLYGKDNKYIQGTFTNAKLVKENFPGWKLRVYMEYPDTRNSKFGVVPNLVIETLENYGVEIYFVDSKENLPSMMWRFLVADDETVDNFIIRDSDSKLSKRDYAATMAWLKSNQTFQCIRDHPSHANFAISGGLWGARRARLRSLLKIDWMNLIRSKSNNYLADMNLLNSLIWPKVSAHAYCSDSVSCNVYPNSFPFPVARYGFEHVGQVFDTRGLARKGDERILESWAGNKACLAPGERGMKQ